MSEDDFISRWSRRKRAADQAAKAPEAPAVEETGPHRTGMSSESRPNGAADANTAREEEVDLSTLPSLDSITAATDMAAFLRKGVPLELTRAALRRAWVADPLIRDFVGLAENAWDFNDPNAMPGFGPLDQTPEQVRQLVAKIVGGVRDAVAAAPPERPHVTASVENACEPALPKETLPVLSETDTTATMEVISSDSTPVDADRNGVAQNESDGEEKMLRRTHGSALPRWAADTPDPAKHITRKI